MGWPRTASLCSSANDISARTDTLSARWVPGGPTRFCLFSVSGRCTRSARHGTLSHAPPQHSNRRQHARHSRAEASSRQFRGQDICNNPAILPALDSSPALPHPYSAPSRWIQAEARNARKEVVGEERKWRTSGLTTRMRQGQTILDIRLLRERCWDLDRSRRINRWCRYGHRS